MVSAVLPTHTIDPVALENEIVQRLQPLNQGAVRVQSTPEDTSELRSPKGDRVLVAFKGFSLSAPDNRINSRAPIIQSGDASFAVILQFKSLRSHQGAFPLMQKILSLVTGFIPETTGKPLYCTGSDFVSNDDGVWTWSMSFTAPLTYVKRSPEV